jgi:glutathione synthase/RimK-type ligase-like ATP-grasp enzyme
MPSVAFATYEQSPELTDDDRLVADVLRRRDVDVHPVVWDAAGVDWPRFDRVIIRSTWDYHVKSSPYEAWVRSFLSRPNQLWNPPAVVLANLSKRYLIELARQGVNVVPTLCIEAGDGPPLLDIIERHGWDEVVIKPAVSASGRGTWRSSRAAAEGDQERFAGQSRAHDVLVQPYCPEVASYGEWSMVFFDGEYSHAVLKKPAEGDFRVQRHLGGTPVAAVPNAGLLAQASAIVQKVGGPVLYARVDGIARDGDFVLMELELNEPFLFLSLSDGAAARFAAAIVRVLRG